MPESDIVSRLRTARRYNCYYCTEYGYNDECDCSSTGDLLNAAAAEIERLRSEVNLKAYRVDRLLNAFDDIDRLIALGPTTPTQIRHRIKEARRG